MTWPIRRWRAAAFYGLALAGFVPAWFAVGAPGRELVHFTGTELVAGTTFRPGSPMAFLGTVHGQPTAQVAAAAGILALLLSLARQRTSRWAAVALGCVAAASLMAAGVLFPNLLRLRVTAGMEIGRGTAYYLAIACFLAGAICAAPGSAPGGHPRNRREAR